MVKRCSYGDCKTDERYPERVINIKFYPFPKPCRNLQKCLKWLRLCGGPNRQLNMDKLRIHSKAKHIYVCSKHFVDGRPTPATPDPLLYEPSDDTPARRIRKQNDAEDGRFGYDQQGVSVDITVEVEPSAEETTTEGDAMVTEMGKPPCKIVKFDPSLHLGATENKTECVQFNPCKEGEEAIIGDGAPPPTILVAGQDKAEIADESQTRDEGSNDDNAGQQECHFCSSMRDEIDHLLKENRKLRKELAKKNMGEDSFKEDNAKVKYYTGLPCFVILMGVLTQLLPHLPQTGHKLSPFQMLLLTLMRLKLNLPVQHIAYLFCVDQDTVSNTFKDTLGTMFQQLKSLVHWPERHYLQATMPHQFVEAFGSCVPVIVDSFEICTQKGSSFKSSAHTFSHCKHHQTMKYLFGITPRGSISFISKGWEGCVSDKHVTENSGLLDQLLPGDLVLADHGFEIGDSGGLMCAELKITGGRRLLDAKDAVEKQQIAHLGVHVDRVTGCVRTKYIMLNGIVPVSMAVPCEGEDMTFLDKIVTVCCALTNMCPSVMKT